MTEMGRLIASVTVENLLDPSKNLRCDALVETGASHMVLPRAWRERLGDLQTFRTVDVETATQAIVSGEVCAREDSGRGFQAHWNRGDVPGYGTSRRRLRATSRIYSARAISDCRDIVG